MRFYYSLEILRGVAAFLIMMVHFNRMVLDYFSDGVGEWVELSAMGVDYFFVLSGFLMYYIYHEKIGNIEHMRDYYLRRVARIYPMFWLSLATMAVIYYFSSSMETPSISNVLRHILLIKPEIDSYGNGRIVGVAWTLELEIIFYTLFGFLFTFKNQLSRIALALILFMVSFFEPYFLLFYFGLAIGWLKVNKSHLFNGRAGALIFLLGAITAIISELYIFDKTVQKISFGLSFSMVIIGLIQIENRVDNLKTKAPKILMYLGSASYTIYLLHIPIGMVLMKLTLLLELSSEFDAWIIVLAMSTLTLFFSILISEKIEMPMNKLLQNKIKQINKG